jgi:hypothetical protein
MVLFGEMHVFFNIAEKAYLEQKKPCSTLKTTLCSKYFFAILTQCSKGNHVLDAPASNKDGVLLRDTCVSLT